MFTSKSALLLAMLIMAGFSAWVSGSANPNPTISTSTPAHTISPLPTASQTATRIWSTLIPSPTIFVPPVPDDKRIVAKIDVGDAPWTMAVENGLLWVIAGDSVVRIDPQTDQVVGKPIPVTVPENAVLDAIVVGQDSVWVSLVGAGNIGVPNDIDSVIRLDPQTGQTVATIKVRYRSFLFTA